MIDNTAQTSLRQVANVVRGMPTSDGAGVRLSRIIGQPALPDLDPFLLLDEFRSDSADDYIAGFPEHPHRGFETVTSMLTGRMRHRDDKGNTGLLTAGSVQWMTAGRGIQHSEMPEQENGLLWGFQLWVNLPAKDKMTTPRYQDIPPERIPEVTVDGARVRVVAGRFGDVEGPVQAVATEPTYLDIRLERGARFESALPQAHNAFIYTIDGALEVGEPPVQRSLGRGELAVLTHGTTVTVSAPNEAARLLLVAGRPLGEPIMRYGPVVMNTKAELVRAFDDIRNGNF
ncbi:MAG: pirin family protein [Candidatus Eremiobacteraeota bacterium]|nr:pirin family protein [Candidatus Eremiobacteraeota bacterium]